MGGYAYSRHSASCAGIAQKVSTERDVVRLGTRSEKLADVREIGAYVAHRAAARLGREKNQPRSCPVLFEAPLAAGLFGNLPKAISGGALYRKPRFIGRTGSTDFSENTFRLWMIHSSFRAWAAAILMTKAWRASAANWWTEVV